MKKYILGMSSVILVFSFIALAGNQSVKQPAPVIDQTSVAGPISECDADPNNLVGNCGFETTMFPPFWGQFGDPSFTTVEPDARHTGAVGALLGPDTSLGYLIQPVATTAGVNYTLSFWLLLESGLPNEFQAWWNDTLLYDNVNGTPFSYQQLTFTNLPGSADGSVLLFGFYHPPAYWHLDDIKVVPQAP